jgi:hypothetical protein
MLNTITNSSPGNVNRTNANLNANNNALAVVNQAISADRQQQNNNQIRQVNSLRLDEPTRSDSKADSRTDRADDNSPRAARSTRTNFNPRFVLSAEQSARLSRLRSGDSENQSVNNSSINQYLSTQSIERRAEIESLVGVDLFV